MPKDAIFRDELAPDTELTYSRLAPPGWEGHTGRIDEAMLTGWDREPEIVFVCGSNGVRRGGDRDPPRCRPARGADPDRALRADRRLTQPASAATSRFHSGLSARQPSSVRRRFQ